MGVPVIVAGDEVVVGFDRARLDRIAGRYAGTSQHESPKPRLGLLVRDVPGVGVEVGGVRPGSLGERAGVRAGDVLESLNGRIIHSVTEVEQLGASLRPGQPLDLTVRRDGRTIRLTAV